MFLQEAAPRLRLWYGRRGLAGRRRLEGVVAGRAAAEGREVEGHLFGCSSASWAVLHPVLVVVSMLWVAHHEIGSPVAFVTKVTGRNASAASTLIKDKAGSAPVKVRLFARLLVSQR